jgi:PIN domain nuclease of toxin-antitoxin system
MAATAAVIDTAPLLAYLGGAERALGSAARRVLRRAQAGRIRLAVPTVCLFEVAQLEERGRISLRMPFEQWCDLVEETPALLLLPLERSRRMRASRRPRVSEWCGDAARPASPIAAVPRLPARLAD